MIIDQQSVQRALALIKKSAVNSDYFFDRLQSPAWIAPLSDAKLFEPYRAVRRGDTISFPVWVPGQYLARMATQPAAQESVVAVLGRVPPSDNPRVYEVVADAAETLPASLGRRLVPQLLRGLELPFQLLLPAKVTKVIVRLSNGGWPNESLQLARALLAIVPPTSPEEKDDNWVPAKPKGRIDEWDYGEALKQITEPLVQSSGIEGFRLYCDLLQQAMAYERRTADDREDGSYIWRPSVERSGIRGENIRDDLVSAVRDAALQVITDRPDACQDVLELLRGGPTKIFDRIALWLLRRCGADRVHLVRDSLKNPVAWGDSSIHPEYELLLAENFGRLPKDTQQRYLEWVEEGPDPAQYVAFRTMMDGQEPSAEDVALHRNVFVRDHLNVLAPYLGPEVGEKLSELLKIGPAREIGRPNYTVSVASYGERSPLTEDETLSIDWSGLIERLHNWSPPDPNDFRAPSREGLANSLRQRVRTDPNGAVVHLDALLDADPKYLSAILETLRDSAETVSLDWRQLIRSLKRITEVAEASSEKADQWRWVSKCVASLVERSFDSAGGSVPIECRDQVWEVIETLAHNSDPTPQHESRYGGTNMDPATLSLNTVRGVTVHAVIRYCLWWRRQQEAAPDGEARIARGFLEFPEAQQLLERHLDTSSEPSLAVRSVYGQWFPWLALIDAEWASDHAQQIFPVVPGEEPWFWAAWGTYVVFSPPFTGVLPILRPFYAHAVERIEEGTETKVGLGERPSERLADHIMTYYWRGEVTLDKADLVATFFEASKAKLRGHAIEWVGRILCEQEAPQDDVRHRLKLLWEWRIQNEIGKEELQSFGWWFASGYFDLDWSFRNLEDVLSRSVLPEPDHLVVERLAEVATSNLERTIGVLEKIIELASKGWAIHGLLESTRKILVLGLESSNAQLRSESERLVHKLGALRFAGFRDLLV
jgi:hypothetical protein